MIRPQNAERVYYLLSATQALAFATMYTVYTVYFVQTARLDPLQLVLVGTVLEAAYFLFEVPTGVIADVYSRRLSILLGVFLLGVGAVVTGAVPVFEVILLAQVVSAIGYTCLSGATVARLADEVGEAQVGAILLRGGQIDRLAGLAGIVLSVVLAGLALHLPYLAGGALLLALGACLVVVMPEAGFAPAPPAGRTTWQTLGQGLRSGVVALRAAPLLLLFLGVEFFLGASSEGADRLGDAHLLLNFTFPALGGLAPVAWFGVLGVAGNLASLVVVEPLRPRLARLSQDPAATARGLLAFTGLAGVGLATFALTGEFWAAAVALLVRDVAFALGRPLFDAWLVQHTRAEVRATQLSMVGQANALGQIVGGPGLGLLGRAVSLRAALLAAAVLLAPALPLFAWAANTPPALAAGEAEAAA